MTRMGLRFIKYYHLLALLLGTCLATSGCGPRITVNLAEPTEHQLETETIELRNCDCQTELVSDVDIQTHCDIEDYAITVSQDERVVIPVEIMTELESELELAFEPVYEMAKATVGQIQLTVPPDKIRTFKFEWNQKTYNSTISFRMGLKTYEANYTYELRIPKETSFVEMSCTA